MNLKFFRLLKRFLFVEIAKKNIVSSVEILLRHTYRYYRLIMRGAYKDKFLNIHRFLLVASIFLMESSIYELFVMCVTQVNGGTYSYWGDSKALMDFYEELFIMPSRVLSILA